MNKLHYFLNILTYYIAWTGGILLAAHGDGWMAAFLVVFLLLLQLCWQWKVRKQTTGLLTLMLILTITGSVIDTVLTASGLIVFAANAFAPYFTPPWMITIWMNFSLLVFATLARLLTHYILAGALSLVGFAVAYAFGVKMGAATFPYGYKTSVLIGLIWGVLLPSCFYVYQRMSNKND